MRQHTTTCLLHGIWGLWTLNTDFKSIRCWNMCWMKFYSSFDFWNENNFWFFFELHGEKLRFLINWSQDRKNSWNKESRICLTAFRCCYKSTMLLFFFFFRFFFSFIRFMLVRDAQTRSLFMFLFVTKLTLNMCVRVLVCECLARMIEWTKQKKGFSVRVRANTTPKRWFE